MTVTAGYGWAARGPSKSGWARRDTHPPTASGSRSSWTLVASGWDNLRETGRPTAVPPLALPLGAGGLGAGQGDPRDWPLIST